MFLDIVDMAMTYVQYLSLVLLLSPDLLPDFYAQPFMVLRYITLETYQVTEESLRYNNPLRLHLPVWLPLDLRLQYVGVAILAPLALATIGLLVVYGKIAYLWMLMLLGSMFMFVFGFATLANLSSLTYNGSEPPSRARLGIVGGIGLPCFLLVLTLGLLCMGRIRLRQLRRDAAELELMIEEEQKRRDSQRVTQSIVNRDGIDIFSVAAEQVYAKKEQAYIDKMDVSDVILQGLFVLVLTVGSVSLLSGGSSEDSDGQQQSIVLDVLGSVGLLLAIAAGVWWILSMFRRGRRLQQECSKGGMLQLLGVLLTISSALYIVSITNFISILYCTPTTCEAGTRLPHAASLFPALENTSASTVVGSSVGCLSCALQNYTQRCSTAMQASLCTTAHTQSRLAYDARVPCESVDGFYRVGGALMFVFYLIFLPYVQFYLAQYGVRVLQDVFPLQRRYYDVFTPEELYYQKVVFSDNSAAFAYRAYKPRFRFYRLSFLLQKIVLGIVGCVMRRGHDSNAVWAGMIFFLVIPIIALVCSLVLRPFVRPTETLFFPATQLMVAVCSVVCLVAQYHPGGVSTAVWVLLLIGIIGVPAVALVAGEVLWLRNARRWGDMLQRRLVEGVTAAYATPDGRLSDKPVSNPLQPVAAGVAEAPATGDTQQPQRGERVARRSVSRYQSEPRPGVPFLKVEDNALNDEAGEAVEMTPFPRSSSNRVSRHARNPLRYHSSSSSSSGSRSGHSRRHSRSVSVDTAATCPAAAAAAAGSSTDDRRRHRGAALLQQPGLGNRGDADGEGDSSVTSMANAGAATETSSSDPSGHSRRSLLTTATGDRRENPVPALLHAQTRSAVLRAMGVIAMETIAAPLIMLYHDHRVRKEQQRLGQRNGAGDADKVVTTRRHSTVETSLSSVEVSPPVARPSGPVLLQTAPLFQRRSFATEGIDAVRAAFHRATRRTTIPAAAAADGTWGGIGGVHTTQQQQQQPRRTSLASGGNSPGQSRRDLGGSPGASWSALPGLTLAAAAVASKATSGAGAGGGDGARRQRYPNVFVASMGADHRVSLSLSASRAETGVSQFSPSQSQQGVGGHGGAASPRARGGQQQQQQLTSNTRGEASPLAAQPVFDALHSPSRVLVPPTRAATAAAAAGEGNSLELSLSLQRQHRALSLAMPTATTPSRYVRSGSRELSEASLGDDGRRGRRLTGDALPAAAAALQSVAAGEYARESTKSFVPSLYFVQHTKSTWWASHALPRLRHRQHRSLSNSGQRHRGARRSTSNSSLAVAAAAAGFRHRMSTSTTRLLAAWPLPWQRAEAGRVGVGERRDEAQREPFLQHVRSPAAAAAPSSAAVTASGGTRLSDVAPSTPSVSVRHRDSSERRNTSRRPTDGAADDDGAPTPLHASEEKDGVYKSGSTEQAGARGGGGGAVLSFTEVYVRRQACARHADERGLARLCTTRELQCRRHEEGRRAFWGNPTDAMLGVVDVPGSMPPWSLYCSAPVQLTSALVSCSENQQHQHEHLSMHALQQQYYAQLAEERQQARRDYLRHAQPRPQQVGGHGATGSPVKKKAATWRLDDVEVLGSNSLLVSPVYTPLVVASGFQLPLPQDPVLAAANEHQAQALRRRQGRGKGFGPLPLDSEMKREQEFAADRDAHGVALLIGAGTPRLYGGDGDACEQHGGGGTAMSVNWLEQWGPMLTELLYEAVKDNKRDKIRRQERRERARWQRNDIDRTSADTNSSRSSSRSSSTSTQSTARSSSDGSRQRSRRRRHHHRSDPDHASQPAATPGNPVRIPIGKLLDKFKPTSSSTRAPPPDGTRSAAAAGVATVAHPRRGSTNSSDASTGSHPDASGQRHTIAPESSVLLSLIMRGPSRHGSVASFTSQSRTHTPTAPDHNDSGCHADQAVASPHFPSRRNSSSRPASSSPLRRHRRHAPTNGKGNNNITTPASVTATATPRAIGFHDHGSPASSTSVTTTAAAATPSSPATARSSTEPPEDSGSVPDPLIQQLRCLFLVRQRLKDSYWEHRDQLVAVQKYIDYEINSAVRRVLTFLFVILGLVATLALALVMCGMLHTVDSHFIGGTQASQNNGVAYELAGYGSWDAFTSSCCCMAATNGTATYPYYAIDVENWVCENGVTKERVRRDGYDNDVMDGYSVRSLCGMTFDNGCQLVVDVDSGTATLRDCNRTVVSAGAIVRW